MTDHEREEALRLPEAVADMVRHGSVDLTVALEIVRHAQAQKQSRVVPQYACEHGIPGGCAACLAFARAQPQGKPVTFWMIERLHSVEHGYGWWFQGTADPTNKDNWTTDANKAARFPSGESAACALSALKPAWIRGAAKNEAFYKLVKPTDHQWFASPPAQAVPDWAKMALRFVECAEDSPSRTEILRLSDAPQPGGKK